MTTEKLKKDLNQLDDTIAIAQPVSKDDLPAIEVKDMNSAELTIELKVGRMLGLVMADAIS